MKITDKKKPIQTVPKGVWESTRPQEDQADKNRENPALSLSTDLQGNGYPAKNDIAEQLP